MIKAYRFESKTGEGMIQADLYQPEDTPRLLVQIVHGMAEHKERYQAFCEFLVDRGYAVCIHDQAGHGASISEPDQKGYFGFPDGCDRVEDDLDEAANKASSLIAQSGNSPSSLPRVLLGHSMGSFIVRDYATRPGIRQAGLILSGTSGKVALSTLGYCLASCSIRIHGPKHPDALLEKMNASGRLKRIHPVRTPFDWLTRDTAIVDQYMSDPLCGFMFTSAGYRDLITWVRRVSKKDWAGKVPKETPILLVSGDEDPVGQYGAGPREVADRLRKTDHNVSLHMYKGARHEILNEINRLEVWDNIAQWLSSVEPRS